jgi:hypothetical protein
MDKRLMNVVPALVADREPAVLRKPRFSVRSTTHRCRPNISLFSLCMPFLAIGLFIPRLLKAPLHFLSSQALFGVQSFSGRLFGLPLPGRLMGSTASRTSSKTIESWTFAALSTTTSGMPLRSEIRWRFVPFFALFVGFAAVFGPPFWGDGSRIE